MRLSCREVPQPINQQDLDDLKNAIQGRKIVSIIGTGVSLHVAKPLNCERRRREGPNSAIWIGTTCAD
jgi:hypothetical protein